MRSIGITPKCLLLLLSIVVLAGCASSQIYQRQLVRLNKGMSPDDASISLQQAALSSYTTVVQGKQYTFQRYSLNNGLNSDIYLLCYESRYAVEKNIQENNIQSMPRLKYWGYIEEFRRYPDNNINQALENILPDIVANSKK